MDGARPRIDPEELLANAGWLRALARNLVADGHRADDVVQQTFVAAVEHPPNADVPLRPWLARVARNFSIKVLRGEGRRALHEAGARSPSPLPSPAESVARTEIFREVVDAVLALDPIYCDVVVLRYFDGLDVPEVARRVGVPVDTARTRLKRALAMLRDRLDRDHGDRRAWALLLTGRAPAPATPAPRAAKPVATAAAAGGGAMTLTKTLVAAAALLLLIGGWYAIQPNSIDRQGNSSNESWMASQSSVRLHVPPRDRSSPRLEGPTTAVFASAPSGASVRVRVTDAETHAPIGRAWVVVREVPPPEAAKWTDADGTLRLDGLPPNALHLSAGAPGHLGAIAAVGPVEGRETGIDLALAPAATIELSTVDPAGVAVANVGCIYDFLGSGPACGSAVTDATGSCLICVPPDVVVRIAAITQGLERASVAVRSGPVRSPPVPAVLRVAHVGRLMGVVRDADGALVAGAIVRAIAALPPTPERPTGTIETATNAEGRYVLEGLVHGRRTTAVAVDSARATRAQSASAESFVSTPGAPDVHRDFVLRPFGKLTVRVTNADGTPAPQASLSMQSGSGLAMIGFRQPGVFEWSAFAPGETTLTAFAPGVGACLRVVDVPVGESVDVSMELAHLPEIAGVVVDETGRAVAGAKISVRLVTSATGGTGEDVATSDAAGRFRGSRTSTGPCVADAAADGFLPSRDISLPAASQDVRIILRRAATVSFRVVDEAGPVRRGTVVALIGDDPTVYTQHPADDGAVRLDCGASGETDVRVFASRDEPAIRSAPIVRRATLASGVVTDLGELRLAARATLRGHVVDLAGRPAPYADVRLDMGSTAFQEDRCYADDKGDFTADFAPASGVAPIRVEAEGFLALHTLVAIDGDAPVTLTLVRGGLVWGEVVDAAGAPLPFAELRIDPAHGSGTTITTDASGVFGRRVAPGRYRVSIVGCNESVDVVEAGETHVRLTERKP